MPGSPLVKVDGASVQISLSTDQQALGSGTIRDVASAILRRMGDRIRDFGDAGLEINVQLEGTDQAYRFLAEGSDRILRAAE